MIYSIAENFCGPKISQNCSKIYFVLLIFVVFYFPAILNRIKSIFVDFIFVDLEKKAKSTKILGRDYTVLVSTHAHVQ